MNMEKIYAIPVKIRIIIILAVSLLPVIFLFIHPPMPQVQEYHNFADQRIFLSIPNVLNVTSNIFFLMIGLIGLSFCTKQYFRLVPARFYRRLELYPYILFFIGITLTAFGSIYYHLLPNNERLYWDRLPMAVTFMAFLSAIISDKIDSKVGTSLLLPLALLGVASVIYWDLTEQIGVGDLRPYFLVQFGPVFSIALILFLFPPRYTRHNDLYLVVLLYLVAKLAEMYDTEIYGLLRVMSGHTLKHLIAAGSVYLLLHMLQSREFLFGPASSRKKAAATRNRKKQK